MKRRIFTLLAGISLVLWLAVAGVWAGSCWRRLGVVYQSSRVGKQRTQTYALWTPNRGSVEVYSDDGFYGRQPGWTFAFSDPAYDSWTEGLWFVLTLDAPTRPSVNHVALQVPLWFPTVLFLFVPLLWLRRFRGLRRRKKLGLCMECGYDLRASKDKCPECGLAVRADLVRKPIA